MTQMPYYPPQPPQGYPAPMQQPYPPQQAPGYPPQQMPQQFGGYPPQGQPQQPPAAPVATGTIADFYNQPTAAGGPGISWKDKAIGTTYRGVISGKCPVQQDVNYDTKQPVFQRDGVTPKWVMQIPLSGVQTNHPGAPEFPDGEAVYYVRGVAKDEMQRAMSEAGCSGDPAEGAVFQVTLTQRKPNRKGNPTNIVQISYQPPNGVPHNAAPAQAAPAQQEQAAPQPQAPAGLPPMQAPVQEQQGLGQPAGLPPLGAPQGQPQQAAPAPLAPMTAPVEQQAAPQWAQPAQAQAPQVAQAQLAPQPPAGLDPAQQAILAQLGAGQVQQG